MIQSFKDKETRAIWETGKTRKFGPDICRQGLKKLTYLNAAKTLDSLKIPTSNHLEALKHDRIGQHSIRINQQWRVCFVWTDAGPTEIEICDFH